MQENCRRDLLRGISYLHTEVKISHGDINTRSIFLDISNQHWTLKIGDFSEFQDQSEPEAAEASFLNSTTRNRNRGSFGQDLAAVARIIYFLLTG